MGSERKGTTSSTRPNAERDAGIGPQLPIGGGGVDEIAVAVLWLASPESSFVVGHDLIVNGGPATQVWRRVPRRLHDWRLNRVGNPDTPEGGASLRASDHRWGPPASCHRSPLSATQVLRGFAHQDLKAFTPAAIGHRYQPRRRTL